MSSLCKCPLVNALSIVECVNLETAFAPKAITVFGPLLLNVFISDFYEGKDAMISERGQTRTNTAWHHLYMEPKKNEEKLLEAVEKWLARSWGKIEGSVKGTSYKMNKV